jgi:hypothetical protein
MTQLLANGAATMRKENPGAGPAEWAKLVYGRALNRRPTSGELQVAAEILGAQPTEDTVADFLWTIFMLPEFQIIR